MLVVPFLFVSYLIISNIGFWDQYSFVDSDLIFHKSIVDKLIDKQLFENDKAMQYYLKIYPKGYHFLLICLSYLKLSVPQISKILGIILSFITPFLFYFLGREIYQDNKTAFLGGLFCGVASVWDTIYIGLPRSIGFILFLSALLCLFRYRNFQRETSLLVILHAIMLLLLLVHPYAFIISWYISIVFFLLLFLEKRKKLYEMRKVAFFSFLFLLFYLAWFLAFKQKSIIALSSWKFLYEHQDVYLSRVPYAFMNFSKLINGIGVLPILIFIGGIAKYLQRPEKKAQYPNLLALFLITFSLVVLLIVVMNVNALFFLRAHRFAPFISSLLYLSGLLMLNEIWTKILNSKVLVLFYCLLLLIPSLKHLEKQLQISKYPYDLDIIPGTHEATKDSQLTFKEILDLAEYVDKNLAKDEVIACSLDRGDLLRMFTRRAVSSSWKIGGMITVYKYPLKIFNEQEVNSKMLYEDPAYLYRQFGIRFFLFEKSKICGKVDMLSDFDLVWESKNIYFCKIRR